MGVLERCRGADFHCLFSLCCTTVSLNSSAGLGFRQEESCPKLFSKAASFSLFFVVKYFVWDMFLSQHDTDPGCCSLMLLMLAEILGG